MKVEFKGPWVENLRNGKYKRGQDFLKSRYPDGEVRHCPLGVLAELVGLPNQETRDGVFYFHPEDPKAHMRDEYSKRAATESVPGMSALYSEVLEEVGLTPEQQDTLTAMNDFYDTPFEEIADWIEEHL
jgi:hypothetical protein